MPPFVFNAPHPQAHMHCYKVYKKNLMENDTRHSINHITSTRSPNNPNLPKVKKNDMTLADRI